jgi:methionyl-tRNA formyltransferase|tara:strand:+ start:518 stop:1081 length:564 start_codon:yes stop_codon:yes gene_type:complete
MTKNEINYKYSRGNLIDERNTYFYTPYLGLPFIDAWQKDRENSIKNLSPSCEPPIPVEVPDDDNTGFALLERLYANRISANFDNKLNLLIQRFEVGKRIYKNYDMALRPFDRSQCHDLSLYLRFAEILDNAYACSGKLIYLNPFLKVMDTLIAFQNDLQGNQEGRLSRLIERELQYIKKLAHDFWIL